MQMRHCLATGKEIAALLQSDRADLARTCWAEVTTHSLQTQGDTWTALYEELMRLGYSRKDSRALIRTVTD
jgi:hypothetical protein